VPLPNGKRLGNENRFRVASFGAAARVDVLFVGAGRNGTVCGAHMGLAVSSVSRTASRRSPIRLNGPAAGMACIHPHMGAAP